MTARQTEGLSYAISVQAVAFTRTGKHWRCIGESNTRQPSASHISGLTMKANASRRKQRRLLACRAFEVSSTESKKFTSAKLQYGLKGSMNSGWCVNNGFQISFSAYAATPESVHSTLTVSKLPRRESTAVNPAARSKSSESTRAPNA